MKFASKGKILDFYILSIFGDRELYGYQIMKEAEKHKVSQSSFYKSLRRLEEAKFLAVRIEVCSGRLRKYYRITAAGAASIECGLKKYENLSGQGVKEDETGKRKNCRTETEKAANAGRTGRTGGQYG